MQNSETKEAKKALDKLFLSPNIIIEKAKEYAKNLLFQNRKKKFRIITS